jgi:hypothetical protein
MKVKRIFFGGSCLISILAPIIALILYPRANWLFALMVVGVAVFIVAHLTSKDPAPQQVANVAEGLLDGWHHGWDVDDYEHLNPGNRALRDLWQRTMQIGGMPEDWVNLDEERKEQMRALIQEIRRLELNKK